MPYLGNITSYKNGKMFYNNGGVMTITEKAVALVAKKVNLRGCKAHYPEDQGWTPEDDTVDAICVLYDAVIAAADAAAQPQGAEGSDTPEWAELQRLLNKKEQPNAQHT